MNNVVNLRETQRTSKLNINSKKINVSDIVLVYDEMVPIVTLLKNCHSNRSIT